MQLKIKRVCKKLKIRLTKKVGKRRVYKSLKTLKNQIKMKLKKFKKLKKLKKLKKNNFGSRKSHFGIGTILLGILAISGLYLGYKYYKMKDTLKKIKMLYPNMPRQDALIISGYINYPGKDKENYWKIIKDKLITNLKNNRKLNDIQKDQVKEYLLKFIEKSKTESKDVIDKLNELDKINKIHKLKKVI